MTQREYLGRKKIQDTQLAQVTLQYIPIPCCLMRLLLESKVRSSPAASCPNWLKLLPISILHHHNHHHQESKASNQKYIPLQKTVGPDHWLIFLWLKRLIPQTLPLCTCHFFFHVSVVLLRILFLRYLLQVKDLKLIF